MRTPGLRLRQVFEHGTHFKVQKPGGETITIAKKGLSPSTVGRLRRFAQGGEVRGYDDGGEVVDPSQADFETAQAKVAATQQAADIATMNAQRYAEEQAAMQPVQTAPRRVVTVASNEAAQQPAPAQPTIIINNTPTPTAQPQALTAAPAVEKAAEAPAKETPREAAPAKTVSAAPAAQAEEPVSAELPEPSATLQPTLGYRPTLLGGRLQPIIEAPATTALTKPTLAMPEVAAPTLPPMGRFLSQPGLLAPMPAAPTLAAPEVAGPVEVAAPAVSVAPVIPIAPAVPAAFKPLTAEGVAAGFKEAVKTDPKATIGQVVGQMLGSDATVPALVRPEVVDIPAFQLMQKPDLLRAFTANIADGINAITEEGRADLAAGQVALDELKQQELAAAEKAKRDVERKEEIQRHIAEATSAAEAADDIKPFFSSGGVGQTIGNIIALAVGGFMSGYTGTPNYVYDAYNKAAARDLDEQRRRRDSRWNKVKTLLGDDKAADLMIQADNDLFTSIALKKASVQQNMLKVQPQIDKLAADFMAKAIQGYGALDLRMAQAEDEREKPAPKVVRGGAGAPQATPATQFRINKYEKERTMDVGGVPVQRNTDKQADKIATDLGNRNFMAQSLAEIVKLFDENPPDAAINILRQTRGEMLARVATSIELFPTGFGFQRAVTDVAKKQLKEALQDPNSFKAFVLTMTGDRDPATGIKTLLKEVTAARREFVLNKADPTSPRDKQAAELGLWRLESKDAIAAGKKASAKPKLDIPEQDLLTVPYFRQQQAAPAAPAAAPTPGAPAAAPAPAPGGARSLLRKVPSR